MIQSHLLSPFLFVLTLLLSGCATQESKVLLGVRNENLKRLQDRFGTPGALQKEIDIAKTDNTGESRNELLNDLILLVDLNYYHWEKLVYDKKAYADFGSAVTATTLSSISAISKVEDVKTVLSAISSGITSTGVAFNSKVLQDQSLTAIFAKMRANRATQLLRLQASMTKTDPIGPNPLSVYSVQQGLIDIATYYNAGTFVAALQDIIEKAATEKTNSETQSNSLKPNPTVINAAAPTAHVQTLKTVVVSKPIPQGLTRADNIQAVVKSGGDILRSLSKDQAQKALTELEPNSVASPNPQEEITGMLMETTTMEQGVRILTALQHAK